MTPRIGRWGETAFRLVCARVHVRPPSASYTSTVLVLVRSSTTLTFLVHPQQLYNALRIQIGADSEDHDHALRFLADLKSGKYNEKYYYFDVLAADWFYVNGMVATERKPPSPLARALHAWDCECVRMHRRKKRWPSLAEQREFLDPQGTVV